MITDNNNKRAIEALKRGDTAYFHGSLCDYLIEVLESLEEPPVDDEDQMLYQPAKLPLPVDETIKGNTFLNIMLVLALATIIYKTWW